MYFIWYNPDLDIYQKGTMREYDRILFTSPNNYRFDVIYEFTNTSQRLIDKVLNALNQARNVKIATSVA